MGFMGRNRVYVIAEIGSNHGGSLAAALDLIDAAADVGADAAKFQAGHADHVYDPAQFPEEHASFRTYLEPPLEWLPLLASRCGARGIDFGCSAFCLDALDAVDPYVKWHKVASIEATWRALADRIVATEKWALVSVGAQDQAWTGSVEKVVPLHCVVSYPADLSECHLRSHPTNTPWGLSDHTTHPTIAPCAAVALGAVVIEKHLRLADVGDSPLAHWYGRTFDADCHHRRCSWRSGEFDMADVAESEFSRHQMERHPRAAFLPAVLRVGMARPGIVSSELPDFPHSLTAPEFREMVEAIRLTETALGSDEKRIRPSEWSYLKYRRGPRGLRGA